MSNSENAFATGRLNTKQNPAFSNPLLNRLADLCLHPHFSTEPTNVKTAALHNAPIPALIGALKTTIQLELPVLHPQDRIQTLAFLFSDDFANTLFAATEHERFSNFADRFANDIFTGEAIPTEDIHGALDLAFGLDRFDQNNPGSYFYSLLCSRNKTCAEHFLHSIAPELLQSNFYQALFTTLRAAGTAGFESNEIVLDILNRCRISEFYCAQLFPSGGDYEECATALSKAAQNIPAEPKIAKHLLPNMLAAAQGLDHEANLGKDTFRGSAVRQTVLAFANHPETPRAFNTRQGRTIISDIIEEDLHSRGLGEDDSQRANETLNSLRPLLCTTKKIAKIYRDFLFDDAQAFDGDDCSPELQQALARCAVFGTELSKMLGKSPFWLLKIKTKPDGSHKQKAAKKLKYFPDCIAAPIRSAIEQHEIGAELKSRQAKLDAFSKMACAKAEAASAQTAAQPPRQRRL